MKWLFIIVENETHLSPTPFFPDHNRIKKISFKGGTTTTTYYMGKSYEKLYKPSGVTQQKHYISAGGVTVLYTKSSNTADKTEYLHKDHLGSTDVLTNANGAIVQNSRSSFDAWGARRNTNWTDTGNFGINIISPTTRGFTGHEHDDEVGLINMNARLYDAKLGRFLTPDTFVQFPYSTQGMNRYAYVNNNPISYTDPTGHFVETLIAALVNYAIKEIVTQAITAIAGNNVELAKALNTITSIYMGGGVVESVANNYGGEKVRQAGQVLRFGMMIASNSGEANRITSEGIEKVAAHAIAGGVVRKLGGGKFANGAGSAAFSAIINEGTGSKDGSNGSEGSNGDAPNQSQGSMNTRELVKVALYVVGKVWNLPNTVIGLAYGGVGHLTGLVMGTNPSISVGNNAIQFLNNPFTQTATTLGNVVLYHGENVDSNNVVWDYAPGSTLNGYAPTGLGNEEMQHTIQGQVLGPLYFPAHIGLGAAAMIRSGQYNNPGWHSSTNVLENCPHSSTPSPWSC